jgi:hypothetical protein
MSFLDFTAIDTGPCPLYPTTDFVYNEAQKEENKPMCFKNATTVQGIELHVDTAGQKPYDSLNYIRDRAHTIFWTKNLEISNAFADPSPKNFKEAQLWVKEGNFRMEKPDWMDHVDDDEDYGDPGYFRWGKTAPDMKKKEELLKALSDDVQDLRDKVTIVTDEQARLAALKEFEAKTYL